VYADHSGPQREGDRLLHLRPGLDPGDDYGACKAACEQVVAEGHPRRLVVRPGLVVGPHDPTDRFAHWPRRMARGERGLAPGDPADPGQFIDVRDLAAWVVRALESGATGVFNATGETTTMGGSSVSEAFPT
jgi:2'-hydroxyisoflavone reductase